MGQGLYWEIEQGQAMSGTMSASGGQGKLLCSRDLEQRPPWQLAAWVSRGAHPGLPALTLLPHTAGSGGHGTPLCVRHPLNSRWELNQYSGK